ncbi:MAG: 5'/3'-nucleotidase SurE [Hormoscilla sp. SP12CHS1]|nr:5'/3'-nucleotidase SurE [Hormoscilla sp. SP12CHS1]
MTLILTNDDGIDAPGIRALQRALDGNGIIVAPKEHLSGCGHQVTTDRPIHVGRPTVPEKSETEYAVGGTPADCSRLAITHLCPDVEWVLSGINAGGNLGVDVYMSGTVAAVREAVILGIPGIAISHWIKKPLVIDWDRATKWTAMLLADLFSRTLDPGSFWNVNLPHLEPAAAEPDIVLCEPSTHPLPVQYRIEEDQYYYIGEYGKRDRAGGTDVDVCFSGNIAVTKLSL